jgi:carbonic anhydrase/acetyltransferase-like protein (isoleucine patch superfamily)
MKPIDRRRECRFRPAGEPCENRLLLSSAAADILDQAGFYRPIRPNTPVLPYGSASSTATFIDPTVRVQSGERIAIASKTFVGPYAALVGNGGYIKVGVGAAIDDNSRILANPNHSPGAPGVSIGNNTVISFGATVRGPAAVGSLVAGAAPTYVGPNALIDGATIDAGAYVSALARVGPGVTIGPGTRVLPGANITTQDEASKPALGKVTTVSAADVATVKKILSDAGALAAGYSNLYQGNSATGLSPGTTTKGVFNGNLAAVEGTSQEPGTSFEPGMLAPTFPSPRGPQLPALLPFFRARATGGVNFLSRAARVASHLGRGNSFRADEGQPFGFASFARTGANVTLNAPISGQVGIGRNLQVGSDVVLLAGPGAPLALGNNVTIGDGAVVARSIVADGASIGSRAYVADSIIPAGTSVPAGKILVFNKDLGTVQW